MKEKIDENILLVGTAHISKTSVEEVEKEIEEFKPGIVAVELCKRRYDSLTEKDKWEQKPVTSLIKSNNAYFMLAQTFLSSIQRKLGKEHGIEPGSEMIAAIKAAREKDLDISLVDRDISVTLKRAWKKMSFKEKSKLLWEFIKAVVGYEEENIEEIDVEELMNQDVITELMEEFSDIAPSVADVLIHERDKYIAKKIFDESKKGKVLAVVGAGHLKGIKNYLEQKKVDIDISELEYVPKKRFNVLKIVGYAIPVLFASLIGYAFLTKGPNIATQMFIYWFLINGIFSAVGTIFARAHPFSILAAFIAAPITSLNPAIAAGWVAGYVEAKIRTPVISDFKDLSDIDNLKDFWNNRVIKLLMVVAFANVGSVIGTIIAFPYLTSFL
ncbi:MAG: TraB/GumN family protein [Candidatus Thermoplasmatota archaeon]